MDKEDLKFLEKQLDANLIYIPRHMHEGLKEYVLRGVPPGGFLEAVLANDFKMACGRADTTNSRHLKAWALVMSNGVPRSAQGSYEHVANWIEHHPTNETPNSTT